MLVTKEMLEKLDYKMQVMFAVFCARQVIHLVKDEHVAVCIKAIETAEGFIEGRASKEECFAVAAAYAAYAGYAAAAAGYAADAAAAYAVAAYAAANAAYAAANAADADKQAIELEQIRYYNELLNFDKIVEEALGV